jgi:hypothetical protein
MQVGFGFLKREHWSTLRFVKLGQKMLHESLKQEDNGEALDALAMPLKR